MIEEVKICYPITRIDKNNISIFLSSNISYDIPVNKPERFKIGDIVIVKFELPLRE